MMKRWCFRRTVEVYRYRAKQTRWKLEGGNSRNMARARKCEKCGKEWQCIKQGGLTLVQFGSVRSKVCYRDSGVSFTPRLTDQSFPFRRVSRILPRRVVFFVANFDKALTLVSISRQNAWRWFHYSMEKPLNVPLPRDAPLRFENPRDNRVFFNFVILLAFFSWFWQWYVEICHSSTRASSFRNARFFILFCSIIDSQKGHTWICR